MFTENLFRKYSKNTAFITDTGDTFTYGDLTGLATDLFNRINQRCLVFCLCRNTLESLTGYISFLSNRVVPVMLDASLDPALLKNLVNLYHPEFVWLPEDYAMEFDNQDGCHFVNRYRLVRLKQKEKVSLHENLALLLTTSGSTGSPKLVRLSYDNVFSNAESIAEYLGISDQERPISSLPMHYSFGLSVINSHLLKGATLLFTNRSIMEKDFWTFLKKEKASSFSGVPYTYEILRKLRFSRMDLPFLKTLTQAGGKLNDLLNREFSEFCMKSGKRFFVMYGQTEATARMSYLPPHYSLSKLGSMGIAIPGGEFSLVDETGNPVKENETIGELVYKGRNVSMGYAECADDLCKGDENKGVLVTGDLAKRDPDGFYYIVGRKKRFIKIYGNRVNLDETERLIKNIIPDCACGGIDDHLTIYMTNNERKAEVIDYISGITGIHPQAFSVKFVEQIPKNSSGKTIYSQLN